MTSPKPNRPKFAGGVISFGDVMDAADEYENEAEQKKTKLLRENKAAHGDVTTESPKRGRRTNQRSKNVGVSPKRRGFPQQRHAPANYVTRGSKSSHDAKQGVPKVTLTPNLHVLQPHSHRRHYPHHLLDHFSSNQLLTRHDQQRHHGKTWGEITPVTTTCDYKDSNFLTGEVPQPIMVKQVLEPSLSSGDGSEGGFPRGQQHPQVTRAGWRKTPQPFRDKKSGGEKRVLERFKFDCDEDKPNNEKQQTRKLVSFREHPDSTSSLRSGFTPRSKLQRARSSSHSHSGRSHRSSQTELSGFEPRPRQNVSSQTDHSKAPTLDEIFRLRCDDVTPDASQTTTSYVTSVSEDDYVDDISLDGSEECDGRFEDLSPNSYFRRHLTDRSKHIHNRLRRIRDHITVQHKGRLDVSNATLTLLNDLEQVVFEAYELYDDFDPDQKMEAEKMQELRRELQSTRRTCRILEYQLMRSEAVSSDAERVGELEEETKLCRHVAVSLHWELQSVDEKLQKIEAQNNDLRQRLATAEIEKTVYEKEALGLGNMVDQMSLHASSVPPQEAPVRRQTVPELQRQIKFLDEECKAILSRLVEVEKQRDSLEDLTESYRRTHGELLPSSRSLENEEWRTKDLKIRIRMAEDQAGVLGRRVMLLELENGNLVKQMEDMENMAAENSRRATTSDVQFLEDEVEALRTALQEAEDQNVNIADQLENLKAAAISREKTLLAERPVVKEQVATGVQTLGGVRTPNEMTSLSQVTWSLHQDPMSGVNRSDSEMTISAINCSDLDKLSTKVATHYRTAMDAETQTAETMMVSDVIQRMLETPEVNKPQGMSSELVRLLARSRDADVGSVVDQLHNLALATRSLLSGSERRQEEEEEEVDKVEEEQLEQEELPETALYRVELVERFKEGGTSMMRDVTSTLDRDVSRADDDVMYDGQVEEETDWSKPLIEINLSTSQRLVLLFLIYVIVTSLPMTSLFKLVFLSVLFFGF